MLLSASFVGVLQEPLSPHVEYTLASSFSLFRTSKISLFQTNFPSQCVCGMWFACVLPFFPVLIKVMVFHL